MKTLLELYNGNMRPLENMYLDKEYYDASLKITEILRTLENILPEQERKIADEIRANYAASEDRAMEIAFCRGFSLGMRLCADCYENK